MTEKLYLVGRAQAMFGDMLRLRRGGCRQGITSMYIDVHGRAARCSNVRQRLPYRGLLATWRELACPPDKWQPEPCILRGLLK